MGKQQVELDRSIDLFALKYSLISFWFFVGWPSRRPNLVVTRWDIKHSRQEYRNIKSKQAPWVVERHLQQAHKHVIVACVIKKNWPTDAVQADACGK